MAEFEASRASELGGPGASTLSELIDQVIIDSDTTTNMVLSLVLTLKSDHFSVSSI